MQNVSRSNVVESVDSRKLITNLLVSMCEQAKACHLDVGIENTPFSLQLPSQDAPFIVMRSYGKGLSSKELIDFYLEQAPNKGSLHKACSKQAKSCYEYSGNFQIASVDDNEKVEASFWFDPSDGVAQPLMLKPEDKSKKDSQGVKISTQVNLADIDTFIATALEVLPAYNVKISRDGQTFELPLVEKHAHPVLD